jgi:hypothetical protein
MPPRSKVLFHGDVVSSSMLRGDSENECLLKELVDGSFNDDEPFFMERKLVTSTCLLLSLSQVYPGF